MKILGDIRKSRCTTGINDTGGKFATSVNDTGGKFATSINNATSFASVVDTGGKFSLVSTIPVATIPVVISANFEKIRNGLNGILRGLGDS